MTKADHRSIRSALRAAWWERNFGLVLLAVLYVLLPVMACLVGLIHLPPRVERGVWALLIANTVRTWRVAALPDSTTFLVPHLVKTWLIPGYCLVPTRPVTARYWVLVAIAVPLVLTMVWFWTPGDGGHVAPMPNQLVHKRGAEYVP